MKLKKLVLAIMLAMFPTLVHAVDMVPQFINLEAVLVDDGGNVLSDDIQQGDMEITIVDFKNTVLYKEVQHQVPIINGAISVLVGQGNDPLTDIPTGGIPYEMFDPSTGDKILRFKLDNQTVPQEDLQLVATPYSYYAQYAMQLKDPITSSQILNGTIKADDLSSEVLDLISQGGNGAKLPISAKSISVTAGRLTYASGNDVQTVLEGFDNTLGIQVGRLDKAEGDIKNLTTNLSSYAKQSDLQAEVTNRQSGDTNLQSQIDTLSGNTGKYVLKAGDVMQGNIAMDDAECIRKNGTPCLVDGVDVSSLKIKTDDLNPNLNTVTVTGSPNGSPTTGTLYKDNVPTAWAHISSTGVIKASFNINNVQHDAKNDEGHYIIFFSSPLNGDAYAVSATATASGGDSTTATVENQQAGKFEIWVASDRGNIGHIDRDFSVFVFGGR